MEFTDLEKYRELRKQFENQTGDHWTNSQGEPDIDYVSWLEQKLVKESDSLPCVSNTEGKLCDKCYDTDGFYLGTTCPKCNRPFRSVKA